MTDTDTSAAELRGLLRFALGLGLTKQTVEHIHAAVAKEAEASGADLEWRATEARKRMLAAAWEGRKAKLRAKRKPARRVPAG